MEFKGTKGEWELDEAYSFESYISCNGLRIADVKHYKGKMFSDPSEREGKANAKLISAAPELLKALTRCVERLDENGFGDTFAVSKAREAINKALK